MSPRPDLWLKLRDARPGRIAASVWLKAITAIGSRVAVRGQVRRDELLAGRFALTPATLDQVLAQAVTLGILRELEPGTYERLA